MAHSDPLDQATKVWGKLLDDTQIKSLVDMDTRETKRHKPAPRKGDQRSQDQEELLRMVTRLALRTEDSLNHLLQEHQYTIHLSQGQGSLIPQLLMATKRWHQSDKATPLRHQLAVEMMATLEDRLLRLSQVPQSDPLWQECQGLMIVDSEGNMPFLRWDQGQKKLMKTKDATLPIGQVLKSVQDVHRLVQDPTTTLRFHSLMKSNDQERAHPGLWMISSRNQGEAWNALRQLCWHSVWLLIRAQIRPQGPERSSLVKEIQKKLNQG